MSRNTAPHPINKHRQKTEATRRKLLAAALTVFARDGFEAARLEDIAKEAGHTRGAFYANFTTKEDLFVALLEQQSKKRLEEISRTLAALETPHARIVAMREFYLSRAKDRRWATLTLEFKLYALRHRSHRAKLAAAHRRIRESFHVELTNKLGAAPPAHTEMERQAKLLLDIIWSGLMLEHGYDPKRVSAPEVTEILGRMFDLLTSRHGRDTSA